MKRVQQLISELKKLPQDLPVMFASDEEGNSYSFAQYTPKVIKTSEIEDALDNYTADEVKKYKVEQVVVVN